MQSIIDESSNMLSNGATHFSSIYSRVVKAHPNRIAFVHHEDTGNIRQYTYAQYDRLSHGCANKLSVLFKRFEKDTVIAIKLKNTPAWVFIFWGVLMCGHRPLLIDSKLSKENTENLLKQSNAVGIITDDKNKYSIETITKAVINDISEDVHFEPNWSDEVIFCSSGTTGNIKLMIFNGFNMVNQLNAAKNLPDNNLDIVYPTTMEDLRLIALIPFHHIFAFSTMFLWYSFYSCTIVFTDYNDPLTLVKDIRDLKVTHIFHVPLFYEVVLKNFINKLDDETKNKVYKLIDYNLGKISRREAGLFIGTIEKKVKEALFGNQIRFLISGGSYLSNEVSSFFNGIGYPLYNGFGMTEVGVTSVELSLNIEDRIKCSIGKPFYGVTYKIDHKGELLIKSNITHVKEIIDGKEIETKLDNEGFFHSGDIFSADLKGNYYLKGRIKDTIITSNGENIYPDEIESYFKKVEGINNLALVQSNNKIVLVIESDKEIRNKILEINKSLPLNKQANEVIITKVKLPLSSSMKVKRFEVKNNYESGEYKIDLYVDSVDILAGYDEYQKKNVIDRLIKIYQAVLFKKEEINKDAHWINDLHSDSMTYVTLISEIDKEFKIKTPIEKYGKLTTLNEFAKEILDSSCK